MQAIAGMRLPRKCQVEEGDFVHMTWKGHNGERVFRGDKNKSLYLAALARAAKKSDFELHTLCVMNSHTHETGRVTTVEGMSRLYRDAHGAYAQGYNERMNRTGAVGSQRYASLVVQTEQHLTNLVHYVHANPVRAKIVKHPKDYQWSTYEFYAYGKVKPWMKGLLAKLPEWYRCLGKTPALRQQAFRRQADAYLRHHGLLPKPGMTSGLFIGSDDWIEKRALRAKQRRLQAQRGVQAPTACAASCDQSGDTS